MPIELKPAATKKFLHSGASPMMKLLSGVKLSGPFMKVLISAVSSAGRRISAFSIRIWNWSQSSGSMPNSKFSGMPSIAHGFATGSKPPISSPPTSSLT